MHYIVYLQDKEDKVIQITICSDVELVNLLQNLDKKRYTVTEAAKLTDNLLSYKEFCQKEKGLETGNS